MNPRGTAPFGYTGSRQYTLQDGLAGMLIEDLFQDRRGLLWVATADGGVSRFDGEAFENFGLSDGLPSLTVMTIVEDAGGQLWFGTLGGGLAAFDGRGFQVYTTEDGLPSDEILGLQPQPDGSMLVLSGAGIGRFADGRCVECTTEIGGEPLGRVHDLVTDSTGTTWLATRTRGIISLDGRCMSPLFGHGGAPNWAWKLAQDASGHLWIAPQRNEEAVVGRYDPRSGHLDLVDVSPPEVAEIVRPGIRHVRVDDRGWLWMARRGVLVHDGQDWYPFSDAFPERDFRSTRLTYEDHEGNIWVGSWGGGLVFVARSGVRRYTEVDGLPGTRVRSLVEDRRGRVWIGTSKGIACHEEDRIRPMTTGPAVFAMEEDRQGTLWVGDAAGKVSKGASSAPRVVAELAGDDHAIVTGLCADQTGRLWVGTSQGLLGHMEEDRFVALEDRLSCACRTIMQDSGGALWIGSGLGSPALYYTASADRLRAADFAGLEAIPAVNALCEHSGMLWLGTIAGLFSIDLRSREVRRFTMAQGLSANRILSLATDRQGRLWIGTEGGGVLSYDGQAFRRLHVGECALESGEVHAILCDRLGRLWFGTAGGLISYQPHHASPGLVIRQLVEGRLLEAPEAVSIPQGTAEVVIHFQGIRFRIDEDPLLYSHRLVGNGSRAEWSEFTPKNRVSYPNLSIGEYRFEVRVRDPEGNVSEAARLQVRIVPDATGESPVDSDPGHSATITRLLEQLRRVAATDMTVLLHGETGTGKGLVARQIHGLSPRRQHAFVHVNCGSLTPSRVESELFGHEPGTFSGADRRKIGLMEQAHEGTLFLDEVADLPPAGQQALLHILDDGLLRRVGGVESVPVDVRVIAATDRDLGEMVKEEAFRAPLYYRLNTFPVVLPPLRDRREEIPGLARHFAAEFARQLRRPVPTLSQETLTYLQKYSWPGNVRELEHLMRRALMLCEGPVLEVRHVSLPDERTEKQQIMDALRATKGRIYGEQGAARLLGMNPERLRSRMRSHGLQRPKSSKR
ncbi:MAG: sigma 54-interacting transcriptional regulator [Gemmatimonadaceae bacterium]|nr:sigma 54-interacting transcriptional regulator [Gemmatimonadaceae bacterium]